MDTFVKLRLEQIFDHHRVFLRRTLLRLRVPARDVEDVEQEVRRGVERGLSAFDPELSAEPDTAVRGWLFRICERQAASHRRTENKRAETLRDVAALEELAADIADPEQRLLNAERAALLTALLERLEPHRRAVVVAYELQELEMDDVASQLCIPLNTAWNRLRLGREDLRAAWRRLAAKERFGDPVTRLPVGQRRRGHDGVGDGGDRVPGGRLSGPAGGVLPGAVAPIDARFEPARGHRPSTGERGRDGARARLGADPPPRRDDGDPGSTAAGGTRALQRPPASGEGAPARASMAADGGHGVGRERARAGGGPGARRAR